MPCLFVLCGGPFQAAKAIKTWDPGMHVERGHLKVLSKQPTHSLQVTIPGMTSQPTVVVVCHLAFRCLYVYNLRWYIPSPNAGINARKLSSSTGPGTVNASKDQCTWLRPHTLYQVAHGHIVVCDQRMRTIAFRTYQPECDRAHSLVFRDILQVLAGSASWKMNAIVRIRIYQRGFK